MPLVIAQFRMFKVAQKVIFKYLRNYLDVNNVILKEEFGLWIADWKKEFCL